MNNTKFNYHLKAAAEATQACIEHALQPLDHSDLVEGMRHAVRGGKCLRGFLVIETGLLYKIPIADSVFAAAAVEALHAYSLVHDDLPCMDDDDLRRGLPTVHKKWNDATAVLVGDALQSLAFDLLSRPQCSADPSIRIALIVGLAKAGGAQGMVLGQAQDIAAETAVAPLSLEQISILQRNKTGALIEWSACAGAILAGEDTTPMQQYAQALGLAFQIVDDILDVEGSVGAVGKAVRKDKEAGKATFVSLLGLTDAKAWAQSLVNEACDAIAPFGRRAESLKAVAQFVVSRNN
ncbi:MAG: polyprenyl synthetase family protein [Planktomarina sp.]|nr:polyprenyl synthetase family protein [Planktomarina sp.]